MLLVIATAASAACSSVYTRGLVDDGHGRPVGGAVVRAYDETGATQLSLDVTNANGCFLMSARAPKGTKRYTLDIQSSGFRTARQDFALSDDVLIVELAPESEPGSSRMRVATPSERIDRWIPNCAPPNTMGSDALAPN